MPKMFFTKILLKSPSLTNYFTHIRLCNSHINSRILIPHLKYSTTKLGESSVEDNKPIAYTKSPASQWQAKSSRIGTATERLWYEPHVILGSIAVFMIYFCVLREESDIDQEFDKTLYQRIKGLEEKQLWLSLQHNEERGLDTTAIRERLREIEKKGK